MQRLGPLYSELKVTKRNSQELGYELQVKFLLDFLNTLFEVGIHIENRAVLRYEISMASLLFLFPLTVHCVQSKGPIFILQKNAHSKESTFHRGFSLKLGSLTVDTNLTNVLISSHEEGYLFLTAYRVSEKNPSKTNNVF